MSTLVHIQGSPRDGHAADYTIAMCLYNSFTGFVLMATDRSYERLTMHTPCHVCLRVWKFRGQMLL